MYEICSSRERTCGKWKTQNQCNWEQLTLIRTLSKQVDGRKMAMLTGRGTAAERELRKHDQ